MAGAKEHGNGTERLGIDVGLSFGDVGRHRTQFKIEKWDLDQIAWTRTRDYNGLRLIAPSREPVARDFRNYRCAPFEEFVAEDANLIVDAGWTFIMNGIAGSAVNKFANASRGRIGGGDTGGASAYGDTDLKAAINAANRYFALINAVPTVGNHTTGLILAAQFTTGNGNFAWAEFGVDSGTASGADAAVSPFFSRGVATPGTKTAAQTWNATVTCTWT